MTGSSSTRRAPSRVPTALAATAALVTATAAVALVVLAPTAPPANAATVPATPPPTSLSPSPAPPSPSPSPTPASPPATASGLAIQRITGIPKVVAPGGTIHPTLEITQTTPYTLNVVPEPIIDFVLPIGVPASRQDITVRMQNPVTAQWVNGEQEAVAWGAGVEMNFHFGDQFAVPPGGKLVLPFEVAFGPSALPGEYTPEFGAAITVRDWPGTMVNGEVSGWGDEVAFLLGTPPPPPPQGPVDPYALGGGGAPAAAGVGPAAPSPAASGVVAPGGTAGSPSPVPAPTVEVSQDPQIDADRVAMYRARELPSVAGAVLVSWLLLLGGYLRRVRRRRDAVSLGHGTPQSR